jgi:hypothetical protein
VELSIAWPVLLHNVAPMQLVAIGKIVRDEGNRVAIQTVQHEFRTMGTPVEHRNGRTGVHPNPAMLAGTQCSPLSANSRPDA